MNATRSIDADRSLRDRRRRDRQPGPAGAAGRDRQLVRAPAGQTPRRRPRRLGDGLQLRPALPQRAHPARADADPPRRAPGLGPALRPRRRGDALRRRDRRRGGRRPDRHQHGLPGAARCAAPAPAPSCCATPSWPWPWPAARPRAAALPVTVKLRSGIEAGDRSGFDLAVRLAEEAGRGGDRLPPAGGDQGPQGRARLRADPGAGRAGRGAGDRLRRPRRAPRRPAAPTRSPAPTR